MGKPIQVMIVDEESSRQSLSLLLQRASDMTVIAEANDGQEAIHRLSVMSPDIILMDATLPVMDGLAAIEKISSEYPGVSVIVVSVQDDVEYVRRCMRAGAKDYLFKPVDIEALLASIREVYQQNTTRRTRNAVAALSEQTTGQSRILAFMSAKGGVGKTTLAVNTAVAFADQGRKVALVDLNLQFGDCSLCLNMKPARTIADLARESSEIDMDVLDRYLSQHSPNLYLLAAPKRPEEAEYIHAHDIRVILQALRKRFDYVLVDTSPVANDMFFASLETADECFMVSTLNLAVLKNNRVLLDLLLELGYDLDKVRHVLNRSNAKNGLKVKDVSKVLQGSLYWELDNDFHFVETAMNEGKAFIEKDKHHRLSKQIYALTARIDEDRGVRMSRRNPLKRFLGR